MTTEEKFKAAVNVIRSLPKNGPYQPSIDMMLKFYAYFKQATLGPCNGNRPAFWDIKGRAKYDAWKNLGNMSKQDAMKKYVDELHQIVETMSYTDKVANFLEAPTDELESLNIADLELVAGDIIERVRSQPNSPLGSREGSPNRFRTYVTSSPVTSASEESDRSDEEYTDTVELPEPKKLIQNGVEPLANGLFHKEHKSRAKNRAFQHSTTDIQTEIKKTIDALKADIDRVSGRVTTLENSRRVGLTQKKPTNLLGINPGLMALIVLWPLVSSFVMHRFLPQK